MGNLVKLDLFLFVKNVKIFTFPAQTKIFFVLKNTKYSTYQAEVEAIEFN